MLLCEVVLVCNHTLKILKQSQEDENVTDQPTDRPTNQPTKPFLGRPPGSGKKMNIPGVYILPTTVLQCEKILLLR